MYLIFWGLKILLTLDFIDGSEKSSDDGFDSILGRGTDDGGIADSPPLNDITFAVRQGTILANAKGTIIISIMI